MPDKNIVLGILAHVDEGKTTLSEAILYKTGVIRKMGRVDHRDAFLDTDSIERARGITVFSKEARFSLGQRKAVLIDTCLLYTSCMRRHVGAVIVKDRHAIATGYNGAPSGIMHCEERGGCIRQQLNVPSGQRHELCMALHAEQNAIIQAAVMGNSVEGGTIYITHQPCAICAKMILNAGIKRIVIKEGYPDELAASILDEAGLKVEKL